MPKKKRYTKPWTLDEVRYLKAYAKRGGPYLAEKLGRSLGSVYKQMRRQNVRVLDKPTRRGQSKHLEGIDWAAVRKEYKKGTGILVLCAKYGTHRNTLRKNIRYRKRSYRPWTEHDIDVLETQYPKLSLPEIAKLLKRSVAAVNRKRQVLKKQRQAAQNKAA